MASVISDKTGKRVEVMCPDGKRRTIRLGHVSKSQAASFSSHVEQLVHAKITGTAPPPATSEWVNGLADKTRGRLELIGLAASSKPIGVMTVEALLKEVRAASHVKPSSLIVFDQCGKRLTEFFGAKKAIGDITPLEAQKWRQQLQADGYAEATISKRVKVAKSIFSKAVKWKLLSDNPFTDLRAGSMKNKARQHYITREVAQLVLDHCPDDKWRLMFALARFGGFRCPSEHLALKWADIDWQAKRIRVTAPKTEHHVGAGHRTIPLFPELAAPLKAVQAKTLADAVYIFDSTRDTRTNFRTQLERIIKRAGVTPWPRLFQNLRSTRQTELEAEWPGHVVCAWMGNSERVAQDHYLQVTDVYFVAAAKSDVKSDVAHSGTAGHSGEGPDKNQRNQASLPTHAPVCPGMPAPVMDHEGPEHSKDSPREKQDPRTLAVNSDAHIQRAINRLHKIAADLRTADLKNLKRELAAANKGGRP